MINTFSYLQHTLIAHVSFYLTHHINMWTSSKSVSKSGSLAFSALLILRLCQLVNLQNADVGCYSIGECLEAVFNNYNNNVTTPEDCHLLCIASTNCKFWTHYVNVNDPEDTVCFAYLNCPGFGNDCGGNECLSGEVECPVQGLCEFEGRCEGDELALYFDIRNLEECAELCACDNDCVYWTYDSKESTCNLVTFCPFVDRTCDSCTSGEKGCDAYACTETSTQGTSNGILQDS